jgi:hypothetical protein
MAPKKKKVKKSKKEKDPKGDEENKEENLAPEYIDPKLAYPEVDIVVKLTTPPNIDELSKYQFLMFKELTDINSTQSEDEDQYSSFLDRAADYRQS